jgi:hypothetical protein
MTVIARAPPQGNRQHAKSDNLELLIVAEWPLNQRNSARVTIERFNDSWLIRCRKWFEAGGGELRPSKHGIALLVKHQLAAGMASSREIARDCGLIAPDMSAADEHA